MKFPSGLIRFSAFIFAFAAVLLHPNPSAANTRGSAAASAAQPELKVVSQPTTFENGSISPANAAEIAYIHATLSLFHSIMHLSTNTISWIDFDQMFGEMNSVDIYVNTSALGVVGSGTRTGSVYLTSERRVILNVSYFSTHTFNPGDAIMLVHEFCGALGYPDENFAISSVLYLTTHPDSFGGLASIHKAELALGKFLDKNPRRTQNVQYASSGGGASGVGGGGDPALALLKAYLIYYILYTDNSSASHVLSELDVAMTVDLEPLDGPFHFSSLSPPQVSGDELG